MKSIKYVLLASVALPALMIHAFSFDVMSIGFRRECAACHHCVGSWRCSRTVFAWAQPAYQCHVPCRSSLRGSLHRLVNVRPASTLCLRWQAWQLGSFSSRLQSASASGRLRFRLDSGAALGLSYDRVHMVRLDAALAGGRQATHVPFHEGLALLLCPRLG